MMLALRTTPRLLGWGLSKDAGFGSTATPAGDDRHAAPPTRSPLGQGTGNGVPAGHRDRPMETQPERVRFGPYRLLRNLDACSAAERFLALHEKRQTSHVVYRFGVFHDAPERRRFIAALEPLARLDHPHLLPVEEYSFAADGRGWVVTPYTGSQIGLMSLSRLLADKGGRMSPSEAEHAMVHMFEAVQAAHAIGLVHGSLKADQILIDRRGSASIELYGLDRRLHPNQAPSSIDDARAEEVGSIVRLGYQLLTGLTPAIPHIAPSRLLKRLDRRWDAFFAAGLGLDSGLSTASAALAGLPGTSQTLPAPARPASRAVASINIPFRGPRIPDAF